MERVSQFQCLQHRTYLGHIVSGTKIEEYYYTYSWFWAILYVLSNPHGCDFLIGINREKGGGIMCHYLTLFKKITGQGTLLVSSTEADAPGAWDIIYTHLFDSDRKGGFCIISSRTPTVLALVNQALQIKFMHQYWLHVSAAYTCRQDWGLAVRNFHLEVY